jgi:homocysteine S-methyltransferase
MRRFSITVEVVPPVGPDPEPLLAKLATLADLPIDRFSVASHPVARPCLSALALSHLIQQRTGRPASLHCTTRDHNRLALQGLLWGARALGINSVLIATGDAITPEQQAGTTGVHDLDVYDLVAMARQAGLETGVALDPRPEIDGLEQEIRRLERKVEAGAQFVITQPVYDRGAAKELYVSTRHLDAPLILGILPLHSSSHARFLHHQVAGIAVPEPVLNRMAQATDPVAEGILGARKMIELAQSWFAGVCLMPAFDRYEILLEILA